jgi:hypothetical protein
LLFKGKRTKKFLLAEKFLERTSGCEKYRQNLMLIEKLKEVLFNDRQKYAFKLLDPINLINKN